MSAPNVTEQQLQSFKMPSVSVGEYVVWHDNAVVTPHPALAMVIEKFDRMVVVRMLSGTTHESVRHIDDPKLLLNNKFLTQNGAWDYTPAHKQRVAEEKALLERIDTLEARVAELEVTTAPKSRKKELATA